MSEAGSEEYHSPQNPSTAEQSHVSNRRIRQGVKIAGLILSVGLAGCTANLAVAYNVDVGVTALLDPNDDPSISTPQDPNSLRCDDASAMVVNNHGTGLDTAGFTANVTAASVAKAVNACVVAQHYGKTYRPRLNGVSVGEYVRSLNLGRKMPVVLVFVSGGGEGMVEEVEELQKDYGDVLTVAGVDLEAVPDDETDLKKPLGRSAVEHYDLQYGKGALFLNNLQGQIDEHVDLSKWQPWNDLFINTNLTRVALTQSMELAIHNGFQGEADPERLRNSDGTMPDIEYQCVSTDDTVDCEPSRQKIAQKLNVAVPMNMIETDVPYMHDKKWISTVYPLVYEHDFLALLARIRNHTPSWYMRG